MSTRLQVLVYENRQLKESAEFDGTIELGRQRDRDEGLFSRKQENGTWRWVIARRDETTVGRNQIHLTPLADGRVKVSNGSDKQPVRFLDRADLQPGGSCEAALPVLIILGPTKTVRVQRGPGAGQMHSLAEATMPPRSAAPGAARFQSLLPPAGGQVTPRDMIGWLHAGMDVLEAATGSTDVFERAARAVVDSVALDSARVLLLENGTWRPQAVQTTVTGDSTRLGPPSSSVLERMRLEKKTFWELPDQGVNPSESLAGVETVVAAPILGKDGTVLGALYGERRRLVRPGTAGITELEAMLVELLARGVAAGLALQEEQRKALSARVQFEQFFTSDLAQQLTSNPNMLEGQDRVVTVMFCDIRGFSRISLDLGAAQTIRWCRDVLDALSECVLEEGGVLVDYVGDGLMAMWGAPSEQPDHASRACRAGLAILERIPALNDRWRGTLGEDMQLGIGINTGVAQVGNVGSQHKFKYGALGNTVNLASRVQGATKYFKARVLITGETAQHLDATFVHRRLGRVRVVNIETPVDLHELFSPEWGFACQAKDHYERALELFEQKEFGPAARTLGNWRGECPNDDPVLVLMYRAVRAMVEGVPPDHPVWRLTEKGN
jgi:adenylate cyclase